MSEKRRVSLEFSVRYAVAGAAFFALALVNTFPLVLNLATHQLGDGGDALHFSWNLWWMKKALMDLHQNPYWTDYIFFPEGTSLVLHSLTPLNGVISIPFQYLFFGNMVLVYNIVALLEISFAGVAMYALVRHLTGSELASGFSGYLFAFSPYEIGHALGHLNLISVGFLPLFALLFIRLHERRRIRDALLAALSLILATLACLYFAPFLALFAALYVGYYIISNKFKLDRRYYLLVAAVAGVYLLVLSPLIIGLLSAMFSGEYASNYNPDFYSPDILTFFLPGPYSFHMRHELEPFHLSAWYARFRGLSAIGAENENYLGLAAMGLAAVAVARVRGRGVAFWVAAALLFGCFTLGTVLKAFGYATDIRLPYHYIYKALPLVSVPGRFQVMVCLSFSVLAGMGLSFLLSRLSTGPRIAFFSGVLLFAAFELLPIPYPVTKMRVGPVYRALAAEPGDFAVIDLAAGNPALAMFNQTVHGKKTTSGFVARLKRSLGSGAWGGPIVRELMHEFQISGRGAAVDDAKIEAIRKKMASLGVRYMLAPRRAIEQSPLHGKMLIPFRDKKTVAIRIY